VPFLKFLIRIGVVNMAHSFKPVPDIYCSRIETGSNMKGIDGDRKKALPYEAITDTLCRYCHFK